MLMQAPPRLPHPLPSQPTHQAPLWYVLKQINQTSFVPLMPMALTGIRKRDLYKEDVCFLAALWNGLIEYSNIWIEQTGAMSSLTAFEQWHHCYRHWAQKHLILKETLRWLQEALWPANWGGLRILEAACRPPKHSGSTNPILHFAHIYHNSGWDSVDRPTKSLWHISKRRPHLGSSQMNRR